MSKTKARSPSQEASDAVKSAETTVAVSPKPSKPATVANGAVPAPSPGKKMRDHPATEDVGLVSNDSLQEGELEAFCAPENALAEEERLRKEREAAEEQREAQRQKVEAVLEKKKFEQLERLLNQSEMFTQFLAEQMVSVEERATEESEEAAAKGGKRKSTGGKSAPPKKHRGDAPPEVTKELCPGFTGSLRDYQLKGVKWLISLYQNGLNGILADQMGLGKTVQTIAFLCHMRGKGINGPFMVLGPLSTLPNWVSEFERWAPDFPVVLYHGSKDERAQLRASRMNKKEGDKTFPVVVTSYEIAIADIKFLAKHKWKYLVVDEGHRLKNMNCKLIRELRTLSTDNKLLLTGTPLQNNLKELWSLLNFLLPDVFTSLENFESWFDFAANVGQEGADKEIMAYEQRNKVISKLHGILKPFLLRRIKSDVETSLPGKMEVILYANMSEKQREINQQLRDKTLAAEMAKSKARGGGGASMTSLNNMLMQMRKNCNHPDLITAPFEGSVFFPPAEQLIADCGKMALMDRLLQRLFANNHKVLIFSQMTAMLDIMDAYLDEKGITAMRIDGSVSWQERQERMKRFNTDPEAKVFLLSTRAGGLGINLTAADTCIIYDSDWNPHQDLQAMDRCHRIGQHKPVLVLRLATAHSVEGKMLRRANSKLMLERLVIKKGAFLDVDASKKSSMSAEELLEVLKADISLDDVPQSREADDEMLERILDRTHLSKGAALPYPESGPGYEVVQQLEGSGLLQGVE